MCNNKTKLNTVRFTIFDYLNFEGLIYCPGCEGIIFTCDIDESDLEKLCNHEKIEIECPHCPASYQLDENLETELIYKCRDCQDSGEYAVDCFNLDSGHFSRVEKCECQRGN